MEASSAVSAHFDTPGWDTRLRRELRHPIGDQVERCWQPAGFLMVRSLFTEGMWEEVGAPAWEALGQAHAGTVAKAGSATWSRLGSELWASVVEMIRQEDEQDPREWASHDFYKTMVGKQADAGEMAVYAYVGEIGLKQIIRRVEGAVELAQSAAVCWSFEHMVIASDRPCLIGLEEKASVKGELSGRKVRRLHSETRSRVSRRHGNVRVARQDRATGRDHQPDVDHARADPVRARSASAQGADRALRQGPL